MDYDFINAQREKRDAEMQESWDKIAERRETQDEALLDIQKKISDINKRIEESEKNATKNAFFTKWMQGITITVAILTLIATIVGIAVSAGLLPVLQ